MDLVIQVTMVDKDVGAVRCDAVQHSAAQRSAALSDILKDKHRVQPCQ